MFAGEIPIQQETWGPPQMPEVHNRVYQIKAELNDTLAFPAGYNERILSRELESAVFPV